MNNILDEFENIIKDFPNRVESLKEADLNSKPAPGKWGKKEILGHLIDSAMTNYQRFVRAQFEDNPQIVYSQDDYCKAADYQNAEVQQLIVLWKAINTQLLFLFRSVIKKELAGRKCNNLTLGFLISDYIMHLSHHQEQILKI